MAKCKTSLLTLLVLLSMLTTMVGCAGDPFYGDVWFDEITISSNTSLHTADGSPIGGGGIGVELDPIFTASDSFPITAAEIVAWNALIGSQWVADANGIHYSLGGVGIHTNSAADELLTLYSNDGVRNSPVFSVMDNSASDVSQGIRVNMTGARTDYTDGIYITNQCTTATAGADKYGIRINNSGNWLGAGSVNYGLYIEEPTGGTTNVGAWIDGVLDMVNNSIENILKINLSNPTELTINAGAVTVTQGFHNVDTEGNVASDFLDTINGGATGDELTIQSAHTDRTVVLRNGIDNIYLKSDVAEKSFSFNSPAGASGIFYAGGFYRAPVADANLSQVGATVNYGTANIAYGAHAFLVAGGAGSVNAGSCSIMVSGTSIDDEGNRIAADSETIVADITTMALNSYYETVKKWLGTITYTLTPTGATTYSADFNYGLCKYDDIGNQHFHITDFECVGRSGANDTGFNIRLLHHTTTGWTYSVAAFVSGGTELCNMNTDYNTEVNLSNGEPFAYKRDNLSVEVDGDKTEGVVVEITTGANKAVDRMDIHLLFHTVPKILNLDSTEEAVMLIYDGTNWCQR